MDEPKGGIVKLTDRRDGPVSIRVAPFRDGGQLEVWIVLVHPEVPASNRDEAFF